MSATRDAALATIAEAITPSSREKARLRIGVVTQLENIGNRRVRLDITGDAWLGYSRDVGLMVGDRAIAIQQRAVTVVIGRLTGTVVTPGGVTGEGTDLDDIASLVPADGDMIRRVAGAWTNQTLDQIITAMGLVMADVAGLVDFFNDYDSHAGDNAAHGGLKQPLDSDLTAIAALVPSNDDLIQRKAGAWAKRTLAELRTDLLIPSDTVTALAGKQPLDSDLTAIAALVPSNDDFIQRKSGVWVNRTMAQLKTDLVLVAGDVGLGLVPNVDARPRSTHTGTQTAATISDFDAAADARITAQKAVALGLATLDASGFVVTSQLPSFVDDVLEYANFASLPGSGTTGKMYVTLDTGKLYRWSGTVYVEISGAPGSTDAVVEGSVNLYYTNARADARIAAAVGVSVQAYNANLAALAGLITLSDRLPYFSGPGAMSQAVFPAQARTLLAASTTALQRSALGLVIGTDVQAADATLLALAGVTTAADKLIYATGVDTFSTTDLPARARTFLAQTTTALQRTDLGLIIGTDVQAYAIALAQIAGLNSVSNDDILQRKAGAWVNRTMAQLKTDLALTATDVGLGSVPNVDARARATHTGTQLAATISDFAAAADARITAQAGVASGLATLDGSGKVPSAQLPSFVDDVLEYADVASLPGTGETGKLYVALDTGLLYRWSGTIYVAVGGSGGAFSGDTDDVPEGSTNLYHTNARVNALIAAAVGVSVQGYDVDLATIAALAPSNDDFMQRKAGAWTFRTKSQVRTDLNLPTDTVTDLAGKQPLAGGLTQIGSLIPTNDDIIQRKAGAWLNRSLAQFRTDLAIPTDTVTELAGKQPIDSDLTDIAALIPTNDDFMQRKAGVWTFRTVAQVRTDLAIPSDTVTALAGKQASDQDLTDIAALAPANDDFMQRKAGAWTFRTPAQVKTDLGLVDIEPTISRIISGYWHDIVEGNNATQALTLSRHYATPFIPPVNCSLTDIAFEVTTAGAAGAVVRLGLYAITSGLPGARSQDLGTVATTAAGIKSITLAPAVSLTARTLYFITLSAQVVTCTVRVRQSNTVHVPWSANTSFAANNTSYYNTAAGAFPDPFGAITGVILGPALMLKLT